MSRHKVCVLTTPFLRWMWGWHISIYTIVKTVFKYVKHVSPQMPKDTSILIWWILKDSLILTSGQWRLGLVWFLTAEVMRRPLQLSFIPHTLMYWGVSNSPKLALNKSPQGDNSISKCKFQPHVGGTLLLPSPGEQWGFQQTWLLLTLLLFPGSGFSTVKETASAGKGFARVKLKVYACYAWVWGKKDRNDEERHECSMSCASEQPSPLSLNYDLCEVLAAA